MEQNQSNNTMEHDLAIKNTKKQMKLLVTYESKFGSTKEVADYIGNILAQGGNKIDIKKISDATDLQRYDGVVIGSAIQYDNWMPKARNFVKENQEYLGKVPVAYFFTCLTLSKKSEKANKKALGYANKLKKLSNEINPVTTGMFAGVLDYSKVPFILGLIVKFVFIFLRVKEGDYRDWNSIQDWAENVNSEFRKNKIEI